MKTTGFFRYGIGFILTVSLLITVHAEDGTNDIKFGGVWLKGTYAEASSKFPVGSSILKPEADLSASKKLLQLIRKNQKSGGSRLVDMVASDDFTPVAASGRALIMALAINYEHYESQRMAGVQKIFAEIGFDLVLVNMSDRSIVFTLPARIQYIDAGSGKAKGERMLRYLYKNKVFPEFLKLAQFKWSGDLAFKTIGIQKITFKDQALKRFPSWMKKSPKAFYSQLIGSSFYKTTGIPLIPVSNGEEVMYANLREEVSDSAAVKAQQINEESKTGQGFILRKPDYKIEIVIPGFVEAIAQRAELGSVAQHAAYCRFIIKDPSNKEIYNRKHDANVTSLLPRGTKLRPLWLSSADASGKMFKSVAKRVKASSSSSIKKMRRELKP